MFYRIEKEYSKKTKKNIQYIWLLITLIIFLIYQKYFIKFPPLNFVEYIFIIFSIIFSSLSLYYIYDMEKILNQQDVKKIKLSIIKLIDMYRNKKRENKIKILTDILNKEKITKKEDIKSLIEYYNKKQPLNIKTSLISILIEASALLISIIGLGYNENNMTFNPQKISVTIAITIMIMLIIYTIRETIKFLASIINLPDTDLYIELEDLLREINSKYNKYFKKDNIIKKITQLFK